MNIGELVQELSSSLGLGDAAFDDETGAEIVVDDRFAISIEPGPDGAGIQLAAIVGAPPKQAGVPFYQDLLEANLFGQGTGGSALSFDRAVGNIILSRSILQSELEFDAFDRELVVFLGALRHWSDRLESGGWDQGEGSTPQAPGSDAGTPPSGGIPV